jgi:hypothetical protein
MGLDAKTYWLTDRQSQCDFDFEFDLSLQNKRQTHPLVREGAPQGQNRNCQTVTNISSWAPDGARHQDRQTDWPSVAMWLRLSLVTRPILSSERMLYKDYDRRCSNKKKNSGRESQGAGRQDELIGSKPPVVK